MPESIEILRCLQKHGEARDSQIAKETGVPLAAVRAAAASLAAKGRLITCSVTCFEKDGPVEAWLYRVSGYMPPAAPGRRAKPKNAAGARPEADHDREG